MKNRLLIKLKTCPICNNKNNYKKNFCRNFVKRTKTPYVTLLKEFNCNNCNFLLEYYMTFTNGICARLISIRNHSFTFTIFNTSKVTIYKNFDRISSFRCKTMIEAYDVLVRYIRNISLM